MRLTDCI